MGSADNSPRSGIDLIETDLPKKVGSLLYGEASIPTSKSQFFRMGPSRKNAREGSYE